MPPMSTRMPISIVSMARVDSQGLEGLNGIVDRAHDQAGEADRGDFQRPSPRGPVGEENAGLTLASGAGEVDEAMLDVGANQLDAQFISDVEALSALRQ